MRGRESFFSIFASHLVASYALTICRTAGVFVLRILADPAIVGVINSVQVIAPLYSALTTGVFYKALRILPSADDEAKNKIFWGHFCANAVEGVFLLVPFLFVYQLLFAQTNSGILLLALIGLYLLSYRSFGNCESGFMAVSLPFFAIKIKFIRICEVVLSLILVHFWGVKGFLFATVVSFLVTLTLSMRVLRFKREHLNEINESIRCSIYSVSIGVDKLIAAVAVSIDSIVVGLILGPVALSGYYLGVSIRGAAGALINSMYWTFWPKAVRDFDANKKSILTNVSFNISYSVIAAFITILIGLAIELILKVWLLSYIDFAGVILVTLSSLTPLAVSEMKRAQLVVDKGTILLPLINLIRVFVFLILLHNLKKYFSEDKLMFVAVSSFFSVYCYMGCLEFLQRKIPLFIVLFKCALSTIPFLIFYFDWV